MTLLASTSQRVRPAGGRLPARALASHGQQQGLHALVVDLQSPSLIGPQRGGTIERARVHPHARRRELPAAPDGEVEQARADARGR